MSRKRSLDGLYAYDCVLRLKVDHERQEALLLDDDSKPLAYPSIEANSIEKILDFRRRGACATVRQSFAAQVDCEFLCKFKGRAHAHARWLSPDEIAYDGHFSAARLRNFDRKRIDGQLEPFNPACMVAQRVIAALSEAVVVSPAVEVVPTVVMVAPTVGAATITGAASDAPTVSAVVLGVVGAAPDPAHSRAAPTVRYLTKWTGLGYDQCTWESVDVVPAELVADFRRRDREAAIRAASSRDAKEGGAGQSSDSQKTSEEWRLVPAGTLCEGMELRDYQREGLGWLRRNYLHGRSVILGDEMGLGKTAQAVAMLQCLRSLHGATGPFLVVVPLSTLQHWLRELQAWTRLDTVVFYGNKEARDTILMHDWLVGGNSKGRAGGAAGGVPRFDVALTTYEMLVATPEPFRRVGRWEYLVIDEGQRLKNREAKVLTVLASLRCERSLVMTGTPLQNHVRELFSLLNFLDPRGFGSLDTFMEQYGDIQSAEQVQALSQALRPYLLRREKADVQLGLQPMEEVLIYVEITKYQKHCYKAILEQNRSLLLRGAEPKTGPSFNNVSMQLRHCCNHPYIIRGVLQAEALDELSDEQFLQRLIQASGKLILLEKLLPRLQEQGHRVLIFSQFVMLLDILEDFVRMSGYTFERIDGAVTGERRQRAIDRFSSDDSASFIFLLGTRAGGVGINLTAADTCIIFDPYWNPQNDVQAQARCHRIGQTKQVRVYRLVTRDTYEMALYERANRKLGLEHALIKHGSYGGAAIDADGSGEGKGDAAFKTSEIEQLIKLGEQKLFTEEHDEQARTEPRPASRRPRATNRRPPRPSGALARLRSSPAMTCEPPFASFSVRPLTSAWRAPRVRPGGTLLRRVHRPDPRALRHLHARRRDAARGRLVDLRAGQL